MLAPLSWLKKYLEITLPPKELGERLTEVGLSTEKILNQKNDKIFEFEITPNRPDLLSMIGIAREIAAIEKKKITYPTLTTDLKPKKNTQILPLKIHPNSKITPRLTGIIINNVTIKESPNWLKEKLISINQRPINNIVDITNFVMFELGNPIHSFDYHSIAHHEIWVKQAKGGEKFESVDGISYHLPKGAIIYEDHEKIFDLVGIKGGKNSGTYPDTKAVFIVVEVDDPILIRKASLALGLRSEASAIFERNVNRGGTIDALKRTVDLIVELAGGEIASELIDIKEQEFKPWSIKLRLERLNFVLGITIPTEKILNILESLDLSPKISGDTITATIPTYRNDLQIEEDLIEEVARIYGYNNFPKTLPGGDIPVQTIPYYKDYELDKKVKHILTSSGFSEIFTYSLISEHDLQEVAIESKNALRVANAVSREFEYLRPTLKGNLLKALKQNKPNFSEIHLFELGKIYKGTSITEAKEEYILAGISNKKTYLEIKGLLERLFMDCNVGEDPTKYIAILDEGILFEVPYTLITQAKGNPHKFVPIPKYPPLVEDLALIAPTSVLAGNIIELIKKQSPLITDVSLLDKYEDTRTFHIVYQSYEKNLTSEDVTPIREKILKALKEKFSARLKE